MQNKNEGKGSLYPEAVDVRQAPPVVGLGDSSSDTQALSNDPVASPAPAVMPDPTKRPRTTWFKRWGVLAVAVLLLTLASVWAAVNSSRRDDTPDSNNVSGRFDTTVLPLSDLQAQPDIDLDEAKSVTINGALDLNGSLILTPSAQPAVAQPGQLYYDNGTNVLAYFNGTQFVSVGGDVVEQISGLTGQITLGAGLAAAGGQISNAGVLSVQGQTGSVVFTGGNGISISGTTITNSGVVSVTSSSPSITVTDDGNGNITLGGSGSGTVSSTGGTAGRIAKFTGAQSIEDSLLAEAGAIVTVNGNLSVTGSTTLGSALAVANGGTGATTLGANGVLVGNGAAAITSVVAGGAGLCLVSGAGAPSWASCTNAGNAVTSLNGLSGVLTIANSSGLVNTITIDDASTANKGIVQFNGTNFSVVGGVANTAQNINTTASPTFSSQTLSGDLAVNGGDITSTGGLNITPAGALTAGSTNQTLTLQGNASSVFTATNGANVTTVSFQSPTASVNYRFATAAAGNYDVCTTVGNCAGGGGVTGSGTIGTLPKFTGASAIGDSLISESGSTITINGNLNLTTGNQYQINSTQISSANLSNNANLAKLDASQTFTGNNVAFQNAANSATAFAVQNALGNRVITVDTAAAELELGQGSTVGGRLVFSNATNANTITLVSAVAGANQIITLPDDTGEICLNTGNCAGAGATLQTSYNNSTDPEIVVDSTRGALTVRDNAVAIGANLFEVQSNAGGVTYFGVTSSGVSVTGTATASGNINSTGGGLQTNSVTRIDNSGNLTNIGTLTLSGAISGGTTYSGSGNINTTGGALQTNSVSRVDNSGNLVNIAAITASGNATLQGGSVTLGTTSQVGSLILNDGSSNTGTLQVAALGQNTVYTLPDPVAGTVSICLTTGNCAGTGTGVTSISGGSTNRLAKFTAAQNVEDSTITDNGTTVTTSVDLVIQGGDVTVGVASTQTGTINFAHSGSAFLGSIAQGALTDNRSYTLPDEGGEICLDSGNCLGPGGNGANIALSNLAGVAINTTLLPGAAGIINLGSGTLPFGDLFLAGSSGTPGTNNFRITGASTSGTRIITLPNDSGTVCINTNNCNYAAASGSANYIQNQIASPQSADFNISGEGRAATLNATTGVNTGAGAGTQRIDASGNLANIGSLTLSGAISGGTTYSSSGNINTTGGALQTNSVSRVDVSGNLVNIGNLTATGAITIASTGATNDITIDGADQFIVQDAAAFNGASVFSADVDLTLAETENLNITNTITGGNSVNLINAVLTNNTSSGTQQIALLQNAVGTGTTVNLLVLDNADSDTEVTTGLVITSAAGGVATGIDLSDGDIDNALSVGANHIVGTTGNIDLSNFDVDGTNGNVTAGTYNGQTISATANLTGTLTVANNLTLTAGDIAVNGGNITSTGALSIDPTGSLTAGAVTQILTLQGNGGTTLSATDGLNTTTLAFTTPTADTTLNFPALSGGPYEICTSSGNCLGAGVTLQAAYNNSTTPEIVVNGTNGAVTIRDNNPAIGANLLEVQNNAASTTYFAVTSSGIGTTGTNVSSGNVNSTGGAIQTASTDRIDNGGNLVNIGTITTSGAINGQTISSTANFTGTATIQGANALTLGVTGSSTGAILFKGATAASGTITLIGQTAPGNRTITLPDETGIVCTSAASSTSNCTNFAPASGGAYANQQLSNLSGTVAINQSLLTGAATIDLGSAASPFRDLYLGGTTTNNFRFTGTAAAARTITLDDLSGRLTLVQTAGGSSAQTGDINLSGTLIAGTALQGTLLKSSDGAGASSALTVRTGDTTGGTGLSTGALTLKTGDGSGTDTNSGNISIDTGTASGSGTTGTISIGGTNASALTLGRSGFTTSNAGALTVTQLLAASGGVSVAANQNLTLQNGTGVLAQTYASSSAGSAQTLSVTNSNSGGSSVAVSGQQITLVGTATSGGINSNSAISFVNPSAAANNNFYGLNFAGTGYTDVLRVNGSQIVSGAGVLQSAGLSGTYSNALALSSASNAFTGATYNGLSLTSAADGFTVAGGTTPRTLTVTGASITIGNTIQPTAAGALSLQSNGANALALDAGGAAAINIAGANANAINIGNVTSNPSIAFTGSGTFGTTTGAISLNGSTTVASTKTFTVDSGLTNLTGNTTGDALNVSNSTSTGNIALFKDNATTVVTIADGGAMTLQPSSDVDDAIRILRSSGSGSTKVFDVSTITGIATFSPVGAGGGSLKITSPDNETGIVFGSSNRADIRFDDSTLKILAGTGTSAPSDTSGLAVDTSGQVGIGTTSPGAKLHVSGDANTAKIRIGSTGAGATAVSQGMGGLELLGNSMNASSKYTPAIKFGSADSDFTTTNPKFLAGIAGVATETYGADTDSGMGIEFLTTPDNAGTAPTPTTRMTLTQDGELSLNISGSSWFGGYSRTMTIGGTAGGSSCGADGCPVLAINSGAGSGNRWGIGVNSAATLAFMTENGTTATSRVTFSPTANLSVAGTNACTIGSGTGATNCTSDARLKNVVGSATGNLSKIMQLQPTYYTWKNDGSQTLRMGLIAQNVQTVLPEFVITGNDGYLQLDYGSIVTPLIGAVHEQQAQIEDAKSDIAALQASSGLEDGGTIAGNLNVSRSTTLQNLTVSGPAVFNGKLTVKDLHVTDITVGGHIISAGDTPQIEAGSAAGAVASASIEGNDTAGTITVTTDASASVAGTLAEVTFDKPFSKVPKVIVTAGNEPASGLRFYRDAETGKFRIKLPAPPLPGTTYIFDYFIVE